jgi:hypothetical protein
MGYENQDLDFVKRTKDIIKQYDSFQLSEDKKYEVTLLLNCFVGLLILPQQRLFDELPTTLITKEEWGIAPSDIITIIDRFRNNEDKNINNIARHLRNSIAHFRFTAVSDKVDKIIEIKFLDYLNDKITISFEATITIDNLRLFINKISSDFIARIETSLGINTSR